MVRAVHLVDRPPRDLVLVVLTPDQLRHRVRVAPGLELAAHLPLDVQRDEPAQVDERADVEDLRPDPDAERRARRDEAEVRDPERHRRDRDRPDELAPLDDQDLPLREVPPLDEPCGHGARRVDPHEEEAPRQLAGVGEIEPVELPVQRRDELGEHERPRGDVPRGHERHPRRRAHEREHHGHRGEHPGDPQRQGQRPRPQLDGGDRRETHDRERGRHQPSRSARDHHDVDEACAPLRDRRVEARDVGDGSRDEVGHAGMPRDPM